MTTHRDTDHMTTPQDNAAFRALFALPPIQASTSTALSVPETPAPLAVTGDRELDAVLWLRDCIKSGHAALIDQALEAFKKIKTPAKELEDRYCNHLRAASGGNIFAVLLGGFGFADLEGLAKNSAEQLARKHEAISRFGSIETLFKKSRAEMACERALRGLKRDKSWNTYDDVEADARFAKHPELVPHTLSDCLFAQSQATKLYWLRHACEKNAGDHWPAFQEHDDYCFRSMARIPPVSKDEALAVFDYLDEDAKDRTEAPSILRNLITSGWTV